MKVTGPTLSVRVDNKSGNNGVLSWSALYVSSVHLNGRSVGFKGSINLPRGHKTYEFRAYGYGRSITKTITV